MRLALLLLVTIIFVSFAGCFMPGIYQSWWFIAILGLFGLNLLLCGLARLKLSKKRWGSTITHFSVLVILLGAMVSFIRGIRGEMELYEGQIKDAFITEKGLRQLPFKVSLEDFTLEWYKPRLHRITVYVMDKGLKKNYIALPGREYKIKGTPYAFTVLNYLPDFSLEAGGVAKSKSGQPDNPAILVRINSHQTSEDRWVFAKHPHISDALDKNIVFFYNWEEAIKEFRSSIRIIDENNPAPAGIIKVNAPLQYKGYTFYQSGYDSQRLNWTALQVVKDPGVPLVFLGFVLLNIGIMVNFYFRLKGK